jgi:hypothetical protein
MMRLLIGKHARRLGLASAGVVVALAAAAIAFYAASGTSSATASVGSVIAPSNVVAQQSNTSVTVSWGAARLSTGGAVQGYTVMRSDGTTVCGSPTLVTTLSCTDVSVPSGNYTYRVTAVFNSFKAAAQSAAITILTAPTITTKPSNPSANSSPSFAFSGGNGSGYQCSLDGGAYATCSSPQAYTGMADGSHTFRVEATAGSSSGPATSYTWVIATAAPTQAISMAAGASHAILTGTTLYYNGSTTGSFQLVDAVTPATSATSPAGATYPAIATTGWTHAAETVTMPTGGPYSSSAFSWTASPSNPSGYAVTGKDSLGNSIATGVTFVDDITAPVTTLTLSPSAPNGSNGWYKTTPSFTLSATDAGAGVATTFYKIDGGTTQTYAGAAVTVSEGTHTISYWSTDNVGNVETTHTTTVKVDLTPPTSSLALAGGLIWGDYAGNAVGHANRDGTSVNQSFETGSGAIAVAASGSYIYWSSYGSNTISRANIDGTNVIANFITGVPDVFGLAADASHLYWAKYDGSVARANLDGTGVNQNFIADSRGTDGVAVDGSHIYWSNNLNNTIGRANLDGTGVNTSLITGASSPGGVAVDASHVYWANFNGGIGRANLDGTSATQSFISSTYTSRPEGLAVDGSYIYWAQDDSTESIGRAGIDGSNPTQHFISGSSAVPTYAYGLASVPASASALMSGTTLYYNGSHAGSFNLADAVSDSGSGPGSASFPAIATSGWTHAAETVSTGSGAAPSVTYTSGAFSWTANPTNPSGYAITSADAAGNTSSTPISFVDDTAAPTGGALSVNSVAATTGGSSSISATAGFTINGRTDYTEAQSSTQSGLSSSTLTVESESLTGTSCGSPGSAGPFTVPTTITGTTQPSGIAVGYCYLYTLTGTDNVGNAASISTTVQVPTYDTTVLGDGPVSWWKLGEVSGNALNSGGTDTTQLAPAGTMTRDQQGIPGSVDGSVLFSGGNLSAATATDPTVSGTYTVEEWIDPTQTGNNMNFFSTRSTGDTSFTMDLENSSHCGQQCVYGEIGTGTSWLTTAAQANFTWTTHKWYYVVYVVTPTGYTIYVDGQSIGNGTLSGTPLLFNPTHVPTIGNYKPGGNESFSGYATEAAVYNKALTSTQVQSHFAAGCPAGTVGSACAGAP